MAEEFQYTREWTDEAAFPLLSFSKSWENPEDYPTYEPDETQVRKDMQSLHDEVKDYLNEVLIPAVLAEDATEEARAAAETARETAEAARAAAETERASAETARAEAETARAAAESERDMAETMRKDFESSRQYFEDGREKMETSREEAENARVDAEAARVEAERTRENAEVEREAAEYQRQSAETQRSDYEGDRRVAEYNRVLDESRRVEAENARVEAESTRQTQENARVEAENARVEAETARAEAESTRQTQENARVTAEDNRNVWEVFDSSKQYYPGNKVAYQGSSYVNRSACSGVAPTDAAHWLLIVTSPDEVDVCEAVIGTTWADGTVSGTKTQTVGIHAVRAEDTANIGCVYDGNGSAASYTAFAKQRGEFLTKISSGVAETVDGGIKFTITGEANTVDIPIRVEAFHNAPRPHIYGVSWDGSSNTKWTRTDDSAFFADPVPYVSGATSYGSPFDQLYPWVGMQVSERTGGTMVSIPKFWYKLVQTANGGMTLQIADRAVEGFAVSPAHMERGDGAGERDVVYIGRYHCSSTDYKSKTGVTPLTGTLRPTCRSSISALGDTIWQSDFMLRFTIWLLYLVEFADWDSCGKIGAGGGLNSPTYATTTGLSDDMPYHTGTPGTMRAQHVNGIQYRHIESLWDGGYEWVDGCYYNSNGMVVVPKPAMFRDGALIWDSYVIGTPCNGFPGAFTVSSGGGFPAFYGSATGGSDGTYSCDEWEFDAGSPHIFAGGASFGSSLADGLFRIGCLEDNEYNTGGGCCRLMELP